MRKGGRERENESVCGERERETETDRQTETNRQTERFIMFKER